MKLGEFFKKNDNKITLLAYLLPIIASVIVSLAHVIVFWEIANPLSWAVFLSIAVEIGVLSSLAASRISNWVWLPFSLVTFIQIIGNIFYSYVNTSITDPLFKSWVELSDPFLNFIGLGTDGDLIVHRRIVATVLGSFVPLMAIVFFQFFIRSIRKIASGETIIATTLGQNTAHNVAVTAAKTGDFEPEPQKNESQTTTIAANVVNMAPTVEEAQAANTAPSDNEPEPLRPMPPMGKLFYFTPEVKWQQPSGGITEPVIEVLPDSVNNEETHPNDERPVYTDVEIAPEEIAAAAATTADQLPEISADYLQPTVAGEPVPAGEAETRLNIDRDAIIKKWEDAGLLEGLKPTPVTAFIDESPAQPAIMVVEDEKKKSSDKPSIADAVEKQIEKNNQLNETAEVHVPRNTAPADVPNVVTQPTTIRGDALSRIKVFRK